MDTKVQRPETLPVAIKKLHLWRGEIGASPAALAEVLQPLADAGVRLRTFLRYKHFRDEKRAVIELCPHESEEEDRYTSIMRAVGFTISPTPALLIEGVEAPGVEYAIARVVAEQNLEMIFCVTQTVDGKWGALMGFVSEADAEKAALALLLLKLEIPEGAHPS